MRSVGTLGFLVLSLLVATPNHARAQESPSSGRPIVVAQLPETAAHAIGGVHEAGTPLEEARQDVITPHITDSDKLDVPIWHAPWVKEVELPRWAPIGIGTWRIDISPTKHVVMLWVAALLCVIVLGFASWSHQRNERMGRAPKGLANAIEAMVLFIRNEVAIPNLGPHGERFVPFILTLFFFILFANLLGLIPYGSTATGDISVTATLALITFVVVEVTGMVTQGPRYLNTIFYWNRDLKLPVRIFMFIIMSPVELIGKFTKPFALAIRLFANMTAGHVVLLAFLSLIFTFASYYVGVVSTLTGVALSLLEIFVALLQAFVFALLSATFIGLIRAGGH